MFIWDEKNKFFDLKVNINEFIGKSSYQIARSIIKENAILEGTPLFDALVFRIKLKLAEGKKKFNFNLMTLVYHALSIYGFLLFFLFIVEKSIFMIIFLRKRGRY